MNTYREPWINGGDLPTLHASCDANGNLVGQYISQENRDRSIKCVNACAGMDDPAQEIKIMRGALEEIQKLGVGINQGSSGWQAERAHSISSRALESIKSKNYNKETDGKKITTEEKNIRICEYLGWKKATRPLTDDLGPIGNLREPCWIDPLGQIKNTPPDHFNNLGDAYNAEEIIKVKRLCHSYYLNLGANGGNNYEWTKIHASAAQRAEAIGITLKLWH